MSEHNHLQELKDRGKTLARETVPALITGGAGDDPSGVLTYTVIGATTGLSQLWLLLLSTPMLAAATIMAARVALTAKAGLATVIERRYGRAVSMVVVLLLVVANTATIAADTAGIAAALELLTGLRWEIFVPFILVALALVLRLGYQQVKGVLTALALVLIAYVVAAVIAQPEWGRVVRATFLPQLSLQRDWWLAALGLLGTTISPYMLFWQADEEVEELHQGAVVRAEAQDTSVWIGMIFSNVISFFIIVAAAITVHAGGGQIQSVADAASTLAPLGPFGDEVFVIGIIGAGLLALPVLSGSTAYAVAEIFGWPEGLGMRAAQARGFYVVLGGSLLGGALISLWPNFHPAAAMFYSQVLNGVLLPIVMLVLLVLSNDPRVIGAARNPRWVNVLAVLTVLVATMATFATLLGG